MLGGIGHALVSALEDAIFFYAVDRSIVGKRLSRASLQQEIAALRGFLRFLAMDARVPHGLDRQIDTPRLYRLRRTVEE